MSTKVQDVKDTEEANLEAKEENFLPFEVKGEEDLMRLFNEHPKYLEEFNRIGAKQFIEKYREKPEEEGESGNKETDKEEDFFAPDQPIEPEKGKK